ncbi:MAG: alkaline shock response membrane anchor protein AmaP [Spirochaetes bacterium]|nr:alkaline shock response membrane anchor protein AmaP [Spirochaetota bacterium]
MNPINIISSVFKVIIYLFIFCLGVGLIGQYYNSHVLMNVVASVHGFINEYVFAANVYSLLWGVIFVAVFIVGVMTLFSNIMASDPYVTIQDEKGYIHVSVDAIRDHVRRIALENSEVIEARAKVVYRRHLLQVSLRVGVSSRRSITSTGDMIKDDVRRSLIDVVGIGVDNIKNIEIAVESIDKRSSMSAPSVR